MSNPVTEIPSLTGDDTNHLQPVQRFVNLVLFQAVCDHAESVEFSLADASSETGFRISYASKGTRVEMHPAPGHLFSPFVVVLCNYASIAYYAKGPVKGSLQTRRPDSRWIFESDDLRKHVLLSKT